MTDPDDSVELHRRLYDALNSGDLPAFFELLDPDVELREEFLAPDTSVYRGHDGVRQWLRSSAALSNVRFEPERVLVAGDTTVVQVRATGEGSGSGAPFSTRLVHVARFRNGKAVLLGAYRDLPAALEAAGLPADFGQP